MVKYREADDSNTIRDIESNRTECQKDTTNERVSGGEKTNDSNTIRDIESLVNEKTEGEKRENMPVTGKAQCKEKEKVRNSKRAAKPPRPRKGPSLSTSDMRLVKEISELVIKKRARIERLKSLKKVRSARLLAAPSAAAAASYMSLFAMIITVLCLIVIIFQGFGSRTTGLISTQFESKLPKLNYTF